MAKQVYFVVAVDLDTGVPFIDDTVLTARFDSNEDTETEKWESDDEDATLYLKALEILNTVPLGKE